MTPLYTSSIGQEVPNIFLNYVQQLAVAQRTCAFSEFFIQYGMLGGAEARHWQASGNVATAALVAVDNGSVSIVNTATNPNALAPTSFDWSDREVFGVYRALGGIQRVPGEANDYLFDAVAPTLFWGYTGLGALDAGSAPVTAGNPPVPAAGTSWAVKVAANLWLYLDAADGQLKLYNNTGATLDTPTLWFFATAQIGARP